MHLLVLGGDADTRRRAARDRFVTPRSVVALDACTLPFRRASTAGLPPPPRLILLEDIDRAFPDAQQSGTRLVLTQSTYLLQTWVDALDPADMIVATADRASLERVAPEAFKRRGAWEHFTLEDLDSSPRLIDTKDRRSDSSFLSTASFVSSPRPIDLLASAYATADPAERLRLCRAAASLDPACDVAHLALGSACRETQDGNGALAAMDRAAALAPDWAAPPFERGKLWLANDEMARARDDFQQAATLMPTFSAAFSNLGATLGELDEPEQALAAFEQALVHDSRSFTIWNNLGVVRRELGRLAGSEDALRRVIAIEPSFVFGHYNLGHTLFLSGRFQESLDAYDEGWRRDLTGNRRQGCRRAIARLATGDAGRAEADFWQSANSAPPDERVNLLLEAYEIVHAFTAADPASLRHSFLDRLGAEIAKSE